MGDKEVLKSIELNCVDIVKYVPHAVMFQSIIKKLTGNITAMSFDAGEGLPKKTSPFEIFLQIIDGKAEIVIDAAPKVLNTGQSIVIPAHASHAVNAIERFKMISTTIKSGYE